MDPKKLAQKIARQIAQEPLEILKTASSQVAGTEVPKPQENYQQPQKSDNQQKQIQNQQEQHDKMQSSRRMEAYQRELEDIRKHDVFKKLQERISQGEQIPLQDYPELSMEQKQVLNAQMEAVRMQMTNNQMTNDKLIIPGSKRGRQMGQKQEAEKQQTRVEKPVPPSG